MKTFLTQLLIVSTLIFSFKLVAISPEETFEEISALYNEYGEADYIGEPISQTEHAKQCSEVAKTAFPNDEELAVGALLHDIGQLLTLKFQKSTGPFGAKNHEKVGALYLKSLGFSSKVISVVKHHVNAKRYLCYKNPSYFNKLSYGSQNSLSYQGGPMKESEALEFEKHPFFQDILNLRFCEDHGKVPGKTTPDFKSYKELVVSHLENVRTERDSNP